MLGSRVTARIHNQGHAQWKLCSRHPLTLQWNMRKDKSQGATSQTTSSLLPTVRFERGTPWTVPTKPFFITTSKNGKSRKNRHSRGPKFRWTARQCQFNQLQGKLQQGLVSEQPPQILSSRVGIPHGLQVRQKAHFQSGNTIPSQQLIWQQKKTFVSEQEILWAEKPPEEHAGWSFQHLIVVLHSFHSEIIHKRHQETNQGRGERVVKLLRKRLVSFT